MGIEYSTEVKQVAAVFKEFRNSIDIYTEDKDEDKNFYVNLLKRLLDGTNIEINDIHPIGCKNEVISACQKDTDDRRSRIYIVDGDIYMQYKTPETINHLFHLDAYCIENFVICEDSICQTAFDLNGGRYPMKDIREKINYNQVIADSMSLIALFYWYSIQSELHGDFDLRHINAFFDMSNVKVDEKKVSKRISEIQQGLFNNGYEQSKVDEALTRRKLTYVQSKDTLLTIVSGKDFLIPLFCNIIRKKVAEMSLPKESWKYHFSKYCNLDRLKKLRDAIVDECNVSH